MVVICLGGAECVWRDFDAARDLIGGRPFRVAACNDAGTEYAGPLWLWATLHPEKMEDWKRARAAAGHPPAELHVAHAPRKRGQPRFEAIVPRKWSGSSGLFVAQVARLHYGATRLVLCGIPMDARNNRYRGKPWTDFQNYRHAPNGSGGWIAAQADPEFGPYVRSMSGWTAERLGRPDRAWLDSA